MGVSPADFLLKEIKADPAKFLFVRGPAGQPVDVARAEGFHEALAESGRKFDVDEVVGNWAPGDAQKVTADAIAAGGMFDGIYVAGRFPGCGDRHARCRQVHRADVGRDREWLPHDLQ